MSTPTTAPLASAGPRRHSVRAVLRWLYEGDGRGPDLFRYALVSFDVLTVAWVVVSSFLPQHRAMDVVDVTLGCLVLVDFVARLAIERERAREFLRLSTWSDLVAALSFMAPVWGEGAGFLRILRTLRLLRNYHLLQSLREDVPLFRRNEEAIHAAVNLAVFVFVMTGFVYATQHRTNPAIGDYVDALYFTVTSLTTTGYGDVTLPGTLGRLTSVAIMLAGVTLFLRLAQVLFRPHKVRFPCPACALQRHDADAVHCKACGTVLCLPDDGD